LSREKRSGFRWNSDGRSLRTVFWCGPGVGLAGLRTGRLPTWFTTVQKHWRIAVRAPEILTSVANVSQLNFALSRASWTTTAGALRLLQPVVVLSLLTPVEQRRGWVAAATVRASHLPSGPGLGGSQLRIPCGVERARSAAPRQRMQRQGEALGLRSQLCSLVEAGCSPRTLRVVLPCTQLPSALTTSWSERRACGTPCITRGFLLRLASAWRRCIRAACRHPGAGKRPGFASRGRDSRAPSQSFRFVVLCDRGVWERSCLALQHRLERDLAADLHRTYACNPLSCCGRARRGSSSCATSALLVTIISNV